jgi:acyl carrier protein
MDDDKEQAPEEVADEVFSQFKECAVEVLQVPAQKVTLEANFADDLDADSLDLVELVMALEERFDITVDETELEGVETVGQAYELVKSKIDADIAPES